MGMDCMERIIIMQRSKQRNYISEEDISQLSVPMLHAVGVNFRDKAKGWSSYELTIALSDKKNK